MAVICLHLFKTVILVLRLQTHASSLTPSVPSLGAGARACIEHGAVVMSSSSESYFWGIYPTYMSYTYLAPST